MAIHVNGDDEELERPAKRRARSAVACQRCKSRKQRCDNEYPSCSNCLSAGEVCQYGVKQVYPAEYVKSLETRIAELERDRTSSHVQEPTIDGDQVQIIQSTNASATDSPLNNNNQSQNLEVGVGFVAMSPNSYLGTSSGLPLAKLVQSAINFSFVNSGHGGRPDVSSAIVENGQRNNGQKQSPTKESIPRASMPEDQVSDELIRAYLMKVHPKHPFLSRKKILDLSQRRKTLRPAHQLTANQPLHTRLDFAILHLIYAIGARYLQLADEYEYISPDSHYAAALEDIDTIFEVRSLENLEAMLLLSIYQLRSPSGPGIWWMIGATIRHCLDGGLHRKSTYPNLLDQRRKRIFWTAYMLERSVARTVGRPYSVTDREIDVALPANINEDIETEEEMTIAITEALTNPNQVTSLSAAIHIIKVQQLESKIHHTVHRVDKAITEINPHKIQRLRIALEEWKSAIPNVSLPDRVGKDPYSTIDYYMIQYHKALLLLLLPFLPSLTPSHPDFRLLATTAGNICQTYKRLHDNQHYISYSLLALHANFVAGLAMVYCFCLDQNIFNARFSGDIRACSTVLYIISERWPAARKVRNAFESLVSATIENRNSPPTQPLQTMQTNSTLPLYSDPMPSMASDTFETDAARLQDNVWDNFETVLEDFQINSETWMQDGIFQAMDAFPSNGWWV